MKVFRNIKPEFIDERGSIAKILDNGRTKIRSVLLIQSYAKAIRGNHFHKKDVHYCYMLSGSMRYSEKKPENKEWHSVVLRKGDMVRSSQYMLHKMEYLELSTMLVLSSKSRHQKNYEKDTVRIQEA